MDDKERENEKELELAKGVYRPKPSKPYEEDSSQCEPPKGESDIEEKN